VSAAGAGVPRVVLGLCLGAAALGDFAPAGARQAEIPPALQVLPAAPPAGPSGDPEVGHALIRLPLACALGAVLALRPKRRGTPTRTPAVVQTQIILAVVGALIMLVVGSSLARAFGIVGAANLIRYRAKIDDPKDAGVMLCTLGVGLAAGVGLFTLAMFATVFILGVLSVIESFEPKAVKRFELRVRVAEGTADARARLETVLERFRLDYELRTTSPEEIVYAVQVPFEVETETVTNAILRLDTKNPPTVEWEDKKGKTK
jgi:uncharacterized membrane protein YhiD involved in acid resistance